MRKIIAIICSIIIILSFASCAKLVSTDYEDVEVLIVGKYHRAMWVQPIYNGKTTTLITHPAVWHITVEYDGTEYTVSGSNTYNKYKDKIGQTVMGKLEINTYDDGTVNYDIIELE